jgi:hypothetical protein
VNIIEKFHKNPTNNGEIRLNTKVYETPYMGVAKVKVTASLKGELVCWIDKEIETSRFASRTHALEYAVTKLKEAESPKIST